VTEKLLACAKGSWQEGIVRDLLRRKEIGNPLAALRGRAKNYYLRYEESFNNLKDRIENTGAKLEYIPGIRGGVPTSKYRLVI